LLKVSYLSGAADFRATYDEFTGADDPAFFGTDYPAQFIELILEEKARAQVITWRGNEETRERYGEQFEVLNRPLPSSGGVRFHFEMLAWSIRQLWAMLLFRPNVLIVTGSQDFWWVYAPLRLLGTAIIPSFHCVQWPIFKAVSRRKRFYAALNSFTVLRSARAIVVTSTAIRRQVETMVGNRVPILQHLPTYNRAQFIKLTQARPSSKVPFSVLFVGRIEANKGVFDMLHIAAKIRADRPGEFHFHFCGVGNALEELTARTQSENLADTVTIHGFCKPKKLSEVIAKCHCYVVPTRSDFEAGYEMTCAEAVLAHRPLVTSAVAPAIDDVREAAIEVPPDDRDAYMQAILQLADNPALYATKVQACRLVAERFYDPQNSWLAAMHAALSRAHIRS
jgi:glycosyltransferase involved in cell wall biosynthesis